MNDFFKALEEVSEFDHFLSDNGLHQIVWSHSDKLGYPTWICVTHDEPYYLVCAQKDID